MQRQTGVWLSRARPGLRARRRRSAGKFSDGKVTTGRGEPGRVAKLRQLDPSAFDPDAHRANTVQLDRHAADVDFDRGQREEPAGARGRHCKHGDVDRAVIHLIVGRPAHRHSLPARGLNSNRPVFDASQAVKNVEDARRPDAIRAARYERAVKLPARPAARAARSQAAGLASGVDGAEGRAMDCLLKAIRSR